MQYVPRREGGNQNRNSSKKKNRIVAGNEPFGQIYGSTLERGPS